MSEVPSVVPDIHRGVTILWNYPYIIFKCAADYSDGILFTSEFTH